MKTLAIRIFAILIIEFGILHMSHAQTNSGGRCDFLAPNKANKGMDMKERFENELQRTIRELPTKNRPAIAVPITGQAAVMPDVSASFSEIIKIGDDFESWRGTLRDLGFVVHADQHVDIGQGKEIALFANKEYYDKSGGDVAKVFISLFRQKSTECSKISRLKIEILKESTH